LRRSYSCHTLPPLAAAYNSWRSVKGGNKGEIGHPGRLLVGVRRYPVKPTLPEDNKASGKESAAN
jgi:hypothetical protein